jgi:hypothetical protein
MEPNFADRLAEELLKLPDSPIGAKVCCLTGFFQADSVISDHTLQGHCDISFGNDGDLFFLAGRNCLQVHEFKYLWTTDELSNFTLKTGFRATTMAALEASNDLTVQKNLIIAAYPLIDEMDAPLYRCVVTTTIGCDTLPSGIPGIGAKRLHALIDEKKPIDANALIGIVIAAKKSPASPELCTLSEKILKESGLSQHAANYGDWSERVKLQTTPPKSIPQPTVTPSSIGDGAVKARTGFVSMFSLLSFAVVVCNGDLVGMMEKELSMTWFEEWFLYFQWEWGRESPTLPL